MPRPNLNAYRDEEDEENDDDVVYSKVSNVGSGFSGMLQQRWSEWIVTGVGPSPSMAGVCQGLI